MQNKCEINLETYELRKRKKWVMIWTAKKRPAQLKRKQCNPSLIFFMSISYFQEVNPDSKNGGPA